jgi:RND family efflux transporter MFP subunit
MKRIFALAAIFLSLAWAGCEKKEPAVKPPLNVTVASVVSKDVTVYKTWVGLLTGNKNSEIQAQVTGYLLTQNYKEGNLVKKGDVLFTIDPRPFQAALAQAQADYGKALAQAQLAQITLNRQTELFKTKVISQQEYDTSYQDTQASIAGAAAVQAGVQNAQINLDYCAIHAPFDGIAGLAQAQIGDLVGPGGTATVLTEVSQVNPIKANFSITEQEYLHASDILKTLQDGKPDTAPSRLKLTLADGTIYDQLGHFDFVNRQVNTATGTIQITALFPNDGNVLRPGLFVRVTAPVEDLTDALVVPQVALVELQGNYLAAVVDAGNKIRVARVKRGPVDGPNQVVTGDLKVGDKVVVGGVEKVRPKMTVNPKPYQPPAAPPATAKPGASPVATPQSSPEATPASSTKPPATPSAA